MRMLTVRLGLLLVMLGLLLPGSLGATGLVAAAPVATPVGGSRPAAPHFGQLPLAFEPRFWCETHVGLAEP